MDMEESNISSVQHINYVTWSDKIGENTCISIFDKL